MKCGFRRTLTSEVDDGDARGHDAYEGVAEQARDDHGEKSDDGLHNGQLKVVLVVQLYEITSAFCEVNLTGRGSKYLNPENPRQKSSPVDKPNDHHSSEPPLSAFPQRGFYQRWRRKY